MCQFCNLHLFQAIDTIQLYQWQVGKAEDSAVRIRKIVFSFLFYVRPTFCHPKMTVYKLYKSINKCFLEMFPLYLQNAHFQIGPSGACREPLGIKSWSQVFCNQRKAQNSKSFAILEKHKAQRGTSSSKVNTELAFYLFPASMMSFCKVIFVIKKSPFVLMCSAHSQETVGTGSSLFFSKIQKKYWKLQELLGKIEKMKIWNKYVLVKTISGRKI